MKKQKWINTIYARHYKKRRMAAMVRVAILQTQSVAQISQLLSVNGVQGKIASAQLVVDTAGKCAEIMREVK